MNIKTNTKLYESADEYGALHNEDCCVNFEDSRSCDTDVKLLECCENMKMVKAIIDESVEKVVEWVSHDMNCKDEEQRKCIVRGYLTGNLEEIKPQD